MFDLDAMQEADERLCEIETQVSQARARFETTISETTRLRKLNAELVARTRETRQFNRTGGCPMAHR